MGSEEERRLLIRGDKPEDGQKKSGNENEIPRRGFYL
jgi:hypothetical protein